MMKKLIPVAVALTCMGAAQAQMVVYGLLDMSYGKNEIAFPGQKEDFFSGGDNGGAGGNQGNSASRFGLKGSTDVGSGIKAKFQLESSSIRSDGGIGAKAGGTPLFGRAAWAGFSGSFGEVRLGLQDDVIFQTVIGYDANGASNSASAWGWGGTGIYGVGRQDRSLQYISPVMGGFKLHASVQPAGNMKDAGAKDTVGAALTYATGPLSVSIAGQSATTNGGSDVSLVVGSYDLGVAKVAVGYANAGSNNKGASFGVTVPVGGVNVGVQLSKNDADGGSTATEFFVNKEILKGTYAYFDYGTVDKLAKAVGTGTESRNAYAIGVIYTF